MHLDDRKGEKATSNKGCMYWAGSNKLILHGPWCLSPFRSTWWNFGVADFFAKTQKLARLCHLVEIFLLRSFWRVRQRFFSVDSIHILQHSSIPLSLPSVSAPFPLTLPWWNQHIDLLHPWCHDIGMNILCRGNVKIKQSCACSTKTDFFLEKGIY